MSKGTGASKKEDAAQAAPAGAAAKPAAPAGGATGGEHHHSKGHVETPKNKGHQALPGGCLSWGCKAQAKRFSFCDEHYDHFKFGLIKKTGEPVPDYEKKIEHYQAYRARVGGTSPGLKKAA